MTTSPPVLSGLKEAVEAEINRVGALLQREEYGYERIFALRWVLSKIEALEKEESSCGSSVTSSISAARHEPLPSIAGIEAGDDWTPSSELPECSHGVAIFGDRVQCAGCSLEMLYWGQIWPPERKPNPFLRKQDGSLAATNDRQGLSDTAHEPTPPTHPLLEGPR